MNELTRFRNWCLERAQPLGLSCEIGDTTLKHLGNSPLESFLNVEWRREAIGQIPLRAWVNVASNETDSVSFTFDGRGRGRISFGSRPLPDSSNPDNVQRGIPL